MSKQFKAGDVVRVVPQGKYGHNWDGDMKVISVTASGMVVCSSEKARGGGFDREELELVPNKIEELEAKITGLGKTVTALLLRIEKQGEQLVHLESRTAELKVRADATAHVVKQLYEKQRPAGWMAGAGSAPKGEAPSEPATYTVKGLTKRDIESIVFLLYSNAAGDALSGYRPFLQALGKATVTDVLRDSDLVFVNAHKGNERAQYPCVYLPGSKIPPGFHQHIRKF